MSKRSKRPPRKVQKRVACGAALAALNKLARGASPTPEAAQYLAANADGWRRVIAKAHELAARPDIPRKLRSKLRRRLPFAEEVLEAALATTAMLAPEPGDYAREILLSGARVGKSRRAPPVMYFDEAIDPDKCHDLDASMADIRDRVRASMIHCRRSSK